MSASDTSSPPMSNSDTSSSDTSNPEMSAPGTSTPYVSNLAKFRIARKRAYRNQTAIDFSKIWPRMLIVSVVLILVSIGSFLLRGVNLGIEFEGGASWELSSVDTSTSEIRDALRTVGLADARIQKLGSNSYRIRAEIESTNTAQLEQVEEALLSNLGEANLEIEFERGASWKLSSLDTSTSEIQDALRTVDFADARIEDLGNESYRIRTEIDETNTAQLEQVEQALLSNLGEANLEIEFEGGASWELSSLDTSTDKIQDALRTVNFADARIEDLGNESYRISAEIDETNTAQLEQVEEALLSNLGGGLDAANISRSAVGPSWGDEITNSTRTALIVFFCLIALYIWIRLEWRMTLAALVAVFHDIVVTVGFYSLFQLEITPATTIAFLTILGYSLYDTLVVFDKIRDNENRLAVSRKHTYSQLVVLSTNQVLMRSVNTTITSVLPVLALLIIGNFVLGAVTLQEFAIALLVGLIAGTYSSLFVATPINAYLKEREEYWVLIRNRLQNRGTEDAKATPIPSIKEGQGPKRPNKRHRITSESRVRTTATHPPRPRKKTK